MFFKILFVILFVTICSGAPPVPQTKSNQAIYSQSFVREDVPMSYQYSAVHYYTPKKHESSNEVEPVKNLNKLAVKPMSTKTVQFAPLDPNQREYLYQTAPVLYTSVVANPASEYEKYGMTENSADSVLNHYHLEPKVMPIDATNVRPSTYKPHMNPAVKVFNSSPVRSNNYRNLKTPTVTTIEIAPKVGMGAKTTNLHHASPSSTTESPKFSHILNLGVSVLPQHGMPHITIPHEFYGITPFQPIPRINYEYHNKGHVVPEKLLGRQIHSAHRIHLSTHKPNTH